MEINSIKWLNTCDTIRLEGSMHWNRWWHLWIIVSLNFENASLLYTHSETKEIIEKEKRSEKRVRESEKSCHFCVNRMNTNEILYLLTYITKCVARKISIQSCIATHHDKTFYRIVWHWKIESNRKSNEDRKTMGFSSLITSDRFVALNMNGHQVGQEKSC